MNWYKRKYSQRYQEIIDNPEYYSDPDDPEYYEANRYFSIGQMPEEDEGDKNYC